MGVGERQHFHHRLTDGGDQSRSVSTPCSLGISSFTRGGQIDDAVKDFGACWTRGTPLSDEPSAGRRPSASRIMIDMISYPRGLKGGRDSRPAARSGGERRPGYSGAGTRRQQRQCIGSSAIFSALSPRPSPFGLLRNLPKREHEEVAEFVLCSAAVHHMEMRLSRLVARSFASLLSSMQFTLSSNE